MSCPLLLTVYGGKELDRRFYVGEDLINTSVLSLHSLRRVALSIGISSLASVKLSSRNTPTSACTASDIFGNSCVVLGTIGRQCVYLRTGTNRISAHEWIVYAASSDADVYEACFERRLAEKTGSAVFGDACSIRQRNAWLKASPSTNSDPALRGSYSVIKRRSMGDKASFLSMSRRSVKIASLPLELVGATGRRYRSKNLLQGRPYIGRVWTATFDFTAPVLFRLRRLIERRQVRA